MDTLAHTLSEPDMLGIEPRIHVSSRNSSPDNIAIVLEYHVEIIPRRLKRRRIKRWLKRRRIPRWLKRRRIKRWLKRRRIKLNRIVQWMQRLER